MSTMTTRSEDRGFTLPEVLITVVTIGIICSVLAGIASVVLRNSPPTEARAEDARSMMGLVTWLPQDVDSTPATGFDTDPTRDTGCGIDAGTNILHMTWSEDLGGGEITYLASYRLVPKGSEFRLNRIVCSGAGAPPYTNGYAMNLTSDLPPLPAGWAPGDAPLKVTFTRDAITNEIELVTFEVTTLDGGKVTTDSASKNPADTLPTTTLPSWYIPTPTTNVFTNTPPTVSSPTIQANPAPQFTSVNLVVNDVDGHSMVVEVDPATIPLGWIVNLASTTLTVAPILTDAGLTKVIEYTADDQNGGVTRGYVTVGVVGVAASTTTTIPPTTTTTVTTTTLPPTCAVTGRSLSRSSVKNVQADGKGGNVNVGVLFKSVTVTATTNGHCAGLEIQYSSGGVNSPGFLNMVQTGATTWEVTLLGKDDGSSETWTDGTHPIEFHSPAGGPWATVNLEVT